MRSAARENYPVSSSVLNNNFPPYGRCCAAHGRARATRKIPRVRRETRGLASRCVCGACARGAPVACGECELPKRAAREVADHIKRKGKKQRTHERRALGASGSARGAGSTHGRDRACATCAVGRPSNEARPAPPPAAGVGGGARGVTTSNRRKNEERTSAATRETREEGARGFGLRPRRGLPLRTAGIARAPNAPRARER